MDKEERKELLENHLPWFTGTEHYFQYVGGMLLTDGVKFLADAAGCYWFLDIIASVQSLDKIRRARFQDWKLTVNQETASAVAVCNDGNYNVLYEQIIEFTDFPLAEIMLFVSGNVILLPSEN